MRPTCAPREGTAGAVPGDSVHSLTGSPSGPFSPGAPLRPASPCGSLGGHRVLRSWRLNPHRPPSPADRQLVPTFSPSRPGTPSRPSLPGMPWGPDGVRPEARCPPPCSLLALQAAPSATCICTTQAQWAGGDLRCPPIEQVRVGRGHPDPSRPGSCAHFECGKLVWEPGLGLSGLTNPTATCWKVAEPCPHCQAHLSCTWGWGFPGAEVGKGPGGGASPG